MTLAPDTLMTNEPWHSPGVFGQRGWSPSILLRSKLPRAENGPDTPDDKEPRDEEEEDGGRGGSEVANNAIYDGLWEQRL